MKIAKNIKCDVEDVPWWSAITQGTTISLVAPKGFVRHVQLTNKGLVIRRMDKAVGFPIEELLLLVESLEPALKVPEEPQSTPTE